MVLNLISTFELSLTEFLSHTIDEEKKLVYDSLLLQVFQAITPANLKYFLSSKSTIEKLLASTSGKYLLGLLEVLLKSQNLQENEVISAILWEEYSKFFFESGKSLQEALVSLLNLLDHGNEHIWDHIPKQFSKKLIEKTWSLVHKRNKKFLVNSIRSLGHFFCKLDDSCLKEVISDAEEYPFLSESE